ncbi:acetylornithine deacetylase [Hypoxylon sp. FL1150]|nr:acetylornithine deacetylase [Hypoxylon sp. FL1150]
MAQSRRPVYFNQDARTGSVTPPSTTPEFITKFHQALPDYKHTKLVCLDDVSKEIGVGQVFLKDESSRFGLSSFKFLGASWGAFRAITRHLECPLDVDIQVLKEKLLEMPTRLIAATDGNHGRAVARMGRILSTEVDIYVPARMETAAINRIREEGATIFVSSGSYDAAIQEAYDAASNKGILVQDFAFENYEEIPKWIIDGYDTMLSEIDHDLQGINPDLVILPVGVGSLAHSVVSHYKSKENPPAILAVEPDTAACLWKSLRRGEVQAEQTTYTIMSGLDCGTISSISWPVLQSGVDASLTISDYEAHLASVYLTNEANVSSGPCGAASLAALRRLNDSDKTKLGLKHDSVVVLLSTEGEREYDTPLDVSVDDPIVLTQTLVRINSANPTLGSIPGPGETKIAQYIAQWLEYRDIETHWIEPTKGRPSIAGMARGSGGGASLMLNGHIDTATLLGYDGDALSGEIRDGKLYGRGAADMKGGVAAALVALANAKEMKLRGDVVFAGVADEEAVSIGTQQVLEAGWKTDAAIVSEPTDLGIVYAHKGFVWLQVNIHGLAAHGSRPDLGVDAISHAGYFLVELDKYARRLKTSGRDSNVGPPSVHASVIKGGEEASSYPALCTIVLERRTVPGETSETVRQEVEALLKKVSDDIPDFRYDLSVTFRRSAFSVPLTDPFVSLAGGVIGKTLEREPSFRGESFWTDCALLKDAGITTFLWGPQGQGLHAKEEFVEVESVKLVADGLTEIASRVCI